MVIWLWSLAIVLVLVLLQSIDHVTGEEYHCYAEAENPYLYFGSKTAYQFVRSKSKIKPVPECTPVQIWLFSRHGTRYPDKETIKEMKNLTQARDLIVRNHENKNGVLCEKDLEGLRKWQYTLRPEQNNQITSQGYEDLKVLAMKLKSSFPELLNSPYSEEKFQFATTIKQRTIDSAKSFAEGLFPGKEIHFPTPPVPDKFLGLQNNCSLWSEKVDNDPNVRNEENMFESSATYKQMIRDISQRLGFNYNLTTDLIELMYDMCRYEKAWHILNTSPWCAVFTSQDLKILEFSKDLKEWYKHGYGNEEINAQLGCPVIRDLVTHFDYVVKSGTADAPAGVFRFSHSGLLLPVLVKLGLGKDSTRITWNNYESLSKREWRTSLMDPFGSNIMAVLYKCKTGEEYNVIFYQNEHVVDYPGCNVGLCSWSYLSNRLKSAFDCNADFCNGSSVSHLSVILTLSLLFLVIYFK